MASLFKEKRKWRIKLPCVPKFKPCKLKKINLVGNRARKIILSDMKSSNLSIENKQQFDDAWWDPGGIKVDNNELECVYDEVYDNPCLEVEKIDYYETFLNAPNGSSNNMKNLKMKDIKSEIFSLHAKLIDLQNMESQYLQQLKKCYNDMETLIELK